MTPSDLSSAGPSRTSILVAAARAFGSHDPDPSVRNPDWLAERLIGPGERARIEPHPISKALAGPYEQGLENPEVAGIVRLMMARTRFFDERLLRAVKAGVRQVVILGAGFDSRAYRFRELLGEVKFFELDTPETQEYKKQRMTEVLGAPPPNLIYAPIDFRTDSLDAVLERAGVMRGTPAFFSWEGVSMYIPEESVRTTLLSLASYGAAGTTLVMDYTTQESIQALMDTRQAPQSRFAGTWGEPWLFGIPDGGEQDFFAQVGFDVVESLRMVSKEATARYATRKDGTVIGTSVKGWQAPATRGSAGLHASRTVLEIRHRLAMWRTHSCVPCRDSSRHLASRPHSAAAPGIVLRSAG